MDMMYIPNAIDGMVQVMEADPARLVHRCCFNITAMSFEPEQVAAAIRVRIPSFVMDYDVDPVRRVHDGALLLGPLTFRWTTWFTKYGGPTAFKWSNRTQVVQADRPRHDMKVIQGWF